MGEPIDDHGPEQALRPGRGGPLDECQMTVELRLMQGTEHFCRHNTAPLHLLIHILPILKHAFRFSKLLRRFLDAGNVPCTFGKIVVSQPWFQVRTLRDSPWVLPMLQATTRGNPSGVCLRDWRRKYVTG